MTKWYEPKEDQIKALESLERALKKCAKAGLTIWDNDGSLYAVDGRVAREPLDEEYLRRAKGLKEGQMEKYSASGLYSQIDDHGCLESPTACSPLYVSKK